MAPATHALLDTFELPAMLLDSSAEVVFVNSAAARVLELKFRGQIGRYQKLLHCFSERVNVDAARARRTPRFESSRPEANYSTLQVCTAEGRTLSTICRCYHFPDELPIEDGTTPERSASHLLVFHPVAGFDLIKQSLHYLRIARRELIDRGIELTNARLRENASSSMHLASRQADLLSLLRDTIEIVDPLLLPSIKLSLDAHVSVLLDVPNNVFSRSIAFALLEAGDFLVPAGSISVRANLDSASSDLSSSSAKQLTGRPYAEVMILAQREAYAHEPSTTLEAYLLNACFPARYTASVFDSLESSERSSGDGQGNASQTVANLSANLKTAFAEAHEQGMTISLRTLGAGMLSILVQAPLQTERHMKSK